MHLTVPELYYVIAIVLFCVGVTIVVVSRELMRLLIGLEVIFLATLLCIASVYPLAPAFSTMLTIVVLVVAVSETILLISIIYKLVRTGVRATVTFREKYRS